MKSSVFSAIAIVAGAAVVAAAQTAHAQEVVTTSGQVAAEVRKELATLPYYGVFDLLTFQVSDKGLVTLGGSVFHAGLKDDAVRAVKKVDGVKEVADKIETQPTSGADDEIRWGVYRAIYRDSFLSRYGTPGDELLAGRPRLLPWGRGFRSWDAFGEPRWAGAPFLGMEPVGNYAIHILVNRGTVTLAGMVDSQGDKDAAGIKANGVMGAFKVVNDLQVAPRKS